VSGPPKNAKDARAKRLEAALRENLRRRKAQARARKTLDADEAVENAPESPILRPGEAEGH
jgi:hypothetical protein